MYFNLAETVPCWKRSFTPHFNKAQVGLDKVKSAGGPCDTGDLSKLFKKDQLVVLCPIQGPTKTATPQVLYGFLGSTCEGSIIRA